MTVHTSSNFFCTVICTWRSKGRSLRYGPAPQGPTAWSRGGEGHVNTITVQHEACKTGNVQGHQVRRSLVGFWWNTKKDFEVEYQRGEFQAEVLSIQYVQSVKQHRRFRGTAVISVWLGEVRGNELWHEVRENELWHEGEKKWGPG